MRVEASKMNSIRCLKYYVKESSFAFDRCTSSFDWDGCNVDTL